MADTLISPTGNCSWEVWERPTNSIVGHIVQDHRTNRFTIIPANNSILAGIRQKPYGSLNETMAAIETFTGGNCLIFGT